MSGTEETARAAGKFIDLIREFFGHKSIVPGEIEKSKAKMIKELSDDENIPIEDRLRGIMQIQRITSLEDTIKLSIPKIKNWDEISNLDEDWFAFFCSKVENVRSDDLKNVWANILAQQVNEPGSVSKMLLDSISLLERKDAELFNEIRKYQVVLIIDDNPSRSLCIPLSVSAAFFHDKGISQMSISRLEKFGLVANKSLMFYKVPMEYMILNDDIYKVIAPEPTEKFIETMYCFLLSSIRLTEDGATLDSLLDDVERPKTEDMEEIIYKELNVNTGSEQEYRLEKLDDKEKNKVINNLKLE